MGALETWIAAVAQVGARVAGLLLVAPFFSHLAVPVRVRAGLVVFLTALLYPASGPHSVSTGVMNWAAVFLSESLVGFLIGLSATLVFEAVQFAGQLLGVQVGLSLVSVLDPQTQADSPVLSMFLQTILLLLFLQLNVHHWLLRAMADSFRFLPPGSASLHGALTENVLRSASAIWVIGFEIAAPVVAATLTADVVFAFLGKASPQMPVLLVGMPLKIVIGLGTLFAAMRFWPALFDRKFAFALSTGERWLHLAR
jgi:flagellar biosynthesis protein FliR